MNRPLWQLLQHGLNFDNEREFTCEECFLVLEFYADQLASEAKPEELRQPVHRHLVHCSDCHEQFLEWIKLLKGEG